RGLVGRREGSRLGTSMIPSEPRAPAREDPSLALGARTEMYDDQGLVMNLLGLLQTRFQTALAGIVPDPVPYAGLVKSAQRTEHGDYQANCAMPLAKVLGRKPRDVAEEIIRR